jgi:hypothetical protein
MLLNDTDNIARIRDCPATQENEIPWDQFAKNDKEVGIW